MPHKKRRLELKAFRQRVDVTLDTREGDTYKSGVSLDTNFDTTQIPEPIPYPEIQRVHAETTSLTDTCDIVQLSAVTAERQFESYVFPSKPIASSASKITGLTLVGEKVLLRSKPVTTVSIHDCLADFITWLESLGMQIVLYIQS